MSILSITFHTTEEATENWDKFAAQELPQLAENLMDVEKYILSEVQSDMLNEGKNTNLLLVFDDSEKRQDFLEIELKNIEERVTQKFGTDVMIFATLLNPSKIKL